MEQILLPGDRKTAFGVLKNDFKAKEKAVKRKNRSSTAPAFSYSHPAETTGLEIIENIISGNTDKDKQKHI